METPLREHIEKLESRLDKLARLQMSGSVTQESRNQIEAEIRAASLALQHYRTAYELEKSLSTQV